MSLSQGLDPLNVQLMKEMVLEQQALGSSIIFSTHQMTDVEELCRRVLLINDGKVLLYGDLVDVKLRPRRAQGAGRGRPRAWTLCRVWQAPRPTTGTTNTPSRTSSGLSS